MHFYIQGGPKVGVQLFHYLFHVLDLIYFWGVVKNKVYERIRNPHTVDELKEYTSEAFI